MGGNFSALLSLVKRYIVDVWEARKTKLYDSCPSKLQSQHSAENLARTNLKGKFGAKPLLYGNVNVIKGKESLVGLAVGDNNNCMQFDSSSAHCCGYVAYGGLAMAAC